MPALALSGQPIVLKETTSHVVLGKLASTDTLQDDQQSEQIPEEQNMTFIRGANDNTTPIKYGPYNINLQLNVTVPQKDS